MRKALLITFVALLLFSMSAFASKTRVETMGMNNTIMVDDYNVYQFPGRISSYPNLAIGEFGSNSGPDDFFKFGINWSFGDDNPWVLGTHFSTEDVFIPQDYDGNDLATVVPAQHQRIDLLYGRQLGTNDFGMRLDYNRASTEDDDALPTVDISKHSSYYYGFTFGLTEGSAGTWDVAAMFGFGGWTDENDGGFKESEPNGYSDLALEARYFKTHSPKITFVHHAKIAIGKRGTEGFDGASTGTSLFKYEQKRKYFEGGIGMNYTSGANMLAVFDFGVRYEGFKGEYTEAGENGEFVDNTFTLPFFKIGLEADVFKWLDVRFGATSYWNATKYEETYNTTVPVDDFMTKDNFAENATYLGFAFNFGRLSIDAMTDPGLFLNGFDFISGDGSGSMNTQLSATYEMF